VNCASNAMTGVSYAPPPRTAPPRQPTLRPPPPVPRIERPAARKRKRDPHSQPSRRGHEYASIGATAPFVPTPSPLARPFNRSAAAYVWSRIFARVHAPGAPRRPAHATAGTKRWSTQRCPQTALRRGTSSPAPPPPPPTTQMRGLAVAAAALSCAAAAPFAVSNVFGDHMVLQRGTSVPVWGFGTPGASVKTTVRGVEGPHRASLPPTAAPRLPHPAYRSSTGRRTRPPWARTPSGA
jgi:hypothetical protein